MVHIGTSGFSYPYWKDRFYPKGLSSSKWLSYYATVFDTLEVNHTFYRFPTQKTLAGQAQKTPDGFRFTVKAHKIITHTLRMRAAGEKIREFLAVCEAALGPKLACVLYQLPPSYSFTQDRLGDILAHVPHEPRQVVELRHASWFDEKVYASFRKAGITFCNVSYPGLPDTAVSTSPVFYKRMHGVPELFRSSYDATQLRALADELTGVKDAYVYFNNTTFAAGYENALRLREMVGHHDGLNAWESR